MLLTLELHADGDSVHLRVNALADAALAHHVGDEMERVRSLVPVGKRSELMDASASLRRRLMGKRHRTHPD
jgi:hypothetical protein